MTCLITINSQENSPALSPSNISKPVAPSSIIPVALDRISQQEPKDLPPIPIQTSLTLEGLSVTGETLAKIVKENPGLTTLNLINCSLLQDKDFQQLAKLPKLTHLTLKGCICIQDIGLKYLTKCASLEHLELIKSPLISEEGINYLRQLKSLRHLTLKGDNITDAAIQSVSHLSSLRELDLSDCEKISDEGVKALTADKLPLLEYLNLNECPISDRGVETIVKHVSLKELHLKHAYITDKSMEKISTLPSLQRLSVYGCSKITDTGIEFIAKQESLKELDLSWCRKVTIKGLEQLKKPPFKIHVDIGFFTTVIKKNDVAFLTFLLESGIRPDIEDEEDNIAYESLLYDAVAQNNMERVTLLLAYGGFDPDKSILDDEGTATTPLQKALTTGNLGLIALLLAYRKDKSNLLPSVPVSPPKKYLKDREYEKLIAKALGPLPSKDKFRFYSYNIVSELRKEAVLLTNPLLDPSPSSIQHAINPLISFVVKETLSDPQFAVYMVPTRQSGCDGDYVHETGEIFLYARPDSILQDTENCEIDVFFRREHQTTLLHEIAHKVSHKLGWHSKTREAQMKVFAAAVKRDIDALSQDRWMNCDEALQRYLDGIPRVYPENEHFEEYLVRTVQVISDIAHADPSLTKEELEAILMQDSPRGIPNLYRIIKEHFLPELEAYNRT